MRLILASGSASRRRMLEAAGVAFIVQPSDLDESLLKLEAAKQGWSAIRLAQELARAKALSLGGFARNDDLLNETLILGCDQVLECADGKRLDKAGSLGELATQLADLSGQIHWLHSAAAIIENGECIWSSTQSAKMTMRTLSSAFITDYLTQESEKLLSCVGGYMIEGRGAQLFSAVEGNNFVVQGLPLLPLLDFLRSKALLPS